MLLAAPLLGIASSAAWALDLQVNHSIQHLGNSATNPQDGPVGGSYTYRTSSGVNDPSGSVSNAVLTQELPSDALFLGITAPAGVTCVGVPAMPAVNAAVGTNKIACTFPTLAAGAPKIVDFNVILPAAHLNNFAYASLAAAGNTDGNALNNDRIPRDITTYERADLAVNIVAPANNSTHQQGTVVQYQIQAQNANSPYAFDLKTGEKAVVRFPLPPGTSWQGSPSSPTNAWSCAASMDNSASPAVLVQICEFTASSAIPKNTNLELLTIPVVVNADSGNTDALVSVAGRTTGGAPFIDADPENNSDEVKINFAPNTQLDMVLVKSVAPGTLDYQGAATQSVVYTLTATRNSGLMTPAGAISITDTLPVGVTYQSVTSEAATKGWACIANGQNLACNFTGTVNADASLPVLTFNASVAVSGVAIDSGTGTKTLSNTATLHVANEPAASTGNNTSTANLVVSNRPSLLTSKAARVDATGNAAVGAIADQTEFFWRITITNNGQVDVRAADTITVTDELDSKLQYVPDATAESPWACLVSPATWTDSTPQTVTCTLSAGIPHAAPNNVSNLNIKVRAHIPLGSLWTTASNQATVGCPASRNCPTLNVLTNTSEVNLSDKTADLSIQKDAAIKSTTNASGAEVEYTLRVKNALPAGGSPVDFQKAQTVVVHDVITNLLNANVDAAAHPITGTPRYSNNRFLEYEIGTLSNGVTGTCDYHTKAIDGTTDLPANQIRVSCTLSNVPVGPDEYEIKIRARQFVNPASSTDQTAAITNKATVSSPDTAEYTGINALPNEDDASVTLEALTNLLATKTASPVSALAGQPITYRLEATNQGPSQANPVKIVDTLPEGMIWVTAPNMPSSGVDGGACSLSGGGSFAAGEVVTSITKTMICTWNDAANVGTRTLTYTLRSASTGYPASVTNHAVVSTSTPETTLADNPTDQTVTLSEPQLDVRITMEHTEDRLPINAGASSRTQYTIRAINSGNSTSYATNVVVQDMFPAPGSTAGFDLHGATVTGVRTIGADGNPAATNRFNPTDCLFGPGGLRCDFPWLAPGESAEITFEMDAVAINNGGLPYGTILHQASVSADAEYLPGLPAGVQVTDNNTVVDRTSAYDASTGFDPDDLQSVDLSLNKTSSTSDTQVGGQIDYRLTVKNEETAMPPNHLVNGNAKVIDVLPVGLTLVGAAPAGCTYAAGTRTLECTVTDLNQGASVDFVFTVRVDTLAYGQVKVVNRASVRSPGDPNPNNDDDEVETPSTPPPPPPATAIPTLSEWGLILLSLLMAGFALRRVSLQHRRRS